jgi:membrane protease YdiL (CAAX protease family)
LAPKSPYRDLLLIVGYIAAVLVCAALLAPALYSLGQAFAHSGQARGWRDSAALGWIVKAAEKTELPGYFDRAALLVALAGLWPLFKMLHIEWRSVVGSAPSLTGWKQLLITFSLAVFLLAIMGVICLWLPVCKLDKHPPWLALGAPLASGFTVAVLEEFLFRGAMLGILRRSLSTRGAVFWTTVVFAILHFLKPPEHGSMAAEPVTWTSGFAVIPQLFRGFGMWQNFLAEFLLLLGVGWALARVRVATDGLWAGIGLHAGWVAGMKYFKQVADITPALHAGDFMPWFAENHCKSIVSPVVGFVPLFTVVLTGFVALLLLPRRALSEKFVATGRE